MFSTLTMTELRRLCEVVNGAKKTWRMASYYAPNMDLSHMHEVFGIVDELAFVSDSVYDEMLSR